MTIPDITGAELHLLAHNGLFWFVWIGETTTHVHLGEFVLTQRDS